MNESISAAHNTVFAAIFFTVLAVIFVMLAYRFYIRRSVFRKTLRQTKMEVPGQIFSIITSEKAGLIRALESEIRNIEKLGLLQPVFKITGQPVNLGQNRSLIIFRIVEEALHNVIKHAKATLVEMRVQFESDNVKLTIRDNGKGFGSNDQKPGRGLRIMRRSAKVIGAHFNLASSATHGTFIMLTIPQSPAS
jgi:nitrate/nitrite-specific signal transduction histidine kinase